MYKLREYISENFFFINKKESIFICAILYVQILYFFNEFVKEIGSCPCSAIEFIIYIFNNFFFIFYISYFIVFYIYNKQINNTVAENYLRVKFKSRKKYLIRNISNIFIIVIGYILLIMIICLIQSLLNLDFNNNWSEYSISLYSRNSSLLDKQPLIIMILSILKTSMYLFILVIIVEMTNMFFRYKIFGFIVAIICNVFNIAIYLYRIRPFLKFSLCPNILINSSNWSIDFNITTIYSFIYLISIITLVLFISLKRINKIDF